MDFQLAWNINRHLNISLAKYRNIEFPDGRTFSFYYYDNGENSNTFNLVALSHEGKDWVSFKPKTDYLLIIRNYIRESDLNQIVSKINLIPKVIHAYLVDLDCNNRINTILEDIELHEINILDDINRKSYRDNRI